MNRLSLLTTTLLVALGLAACQATDQPAGDGNPATALPPPSASEAAPSGAITDTSAAALSVNGGGGPSGDLVADVNGSPITLAEFQRQAFDTQRFYVDKGVDPNTDDGQRQLLLIRRQVLDDMINQKLIEQAADEMGMKVTDEELDATISDTVKASGGQEQFDATLVQTGSSLEDFRRMQAAALIGKKMIDQVIAKDVKTTDEARHARHILCQSEADCQAALQRLDAGEAFDKVAAEVSADETNKQLGGDLGWVTRGGLVPTDIENVVFSLAAGQRSAIVKSDLGYHVIEVTEVNPAYQLTDEQLNQLKSHKVIDWMTARRKQATITVYLDDLKDIVADAAPPAGAAAPATP